MWQKVKTCLAALKDIKSLLGLLPAALALINNHLYAVLPLSQLLRPWASVCLVFFAILGVGLTASKIKDRTGVANLTRWLRTLAVIWAVVGFVAVGFYMYLIEIFEQYSYN